MYAAVASFCLAPSPALVMAPEGDDDHHKPPRHLAVVWSQGWRLLSDTESGGARGGGPPWGFAEPHAML